MEMALKMDNRAMAAARGDKLDAVMSIDKVDAGETRLVREIRTDDEEMKAFLFRLGCYEGEPITLISKRRHGCVVAIKDGRYNLDNYLAEAILV